mgnify:FL=1
MLVQNDGDKPKFDMIEVVRSLGIELIPSQQKCIVNTMGKARSLIVAHPGWGSTSMSALIALLTAWMKPGRRVGCFSPSWRQSKLIYDQVRDIIQRSYLLQTSIKDHAIFDSKWSVVFNEAEGLNASRIDSFTLSDACHLKGYRCHTVILDESCHIPEKVFNMVIRPMMATCADPVSTVRYQQEMETISKLQMLSTKQKVAALEDLEYNYRGVQPRSQIIMFTKAHCKANYLYKLYQNWTGDPDAFTVTYPYYDSPLDFLDSRIVGRAKIEMTPGMFKAIYEGEWAD